MTYYFNEIIQLNGKYCISNCFLLYSPLSTMEKEMKRQAALIPLICIFIMSDLRLQVNKACLHVHMDNVNNSIYR